MNVWVVKCLGKILRMILCNSLSYQLSVGRSPRIPKARSWRELTTWPTDTVFGYLFLSPLSHSLSLGLLGKQKKETFANNWLEWKRTMDKCANLQKSSYKARCSVQGDIPLKLNYSSVINVGQTQSLSGQDWNWRNKNLPKAQKAPNEAPED